MTPCVSREYFGYDVLGSLVVALDSGGNVAGTQLYGPYGNQRYTTGSLPTSLGYAGQRADSVTGLDYDVARYYDPVVGQFLAADTVQGNEQGQDPYAYVRGNPETRTDPTGHRYVPIADPLDDTGSAPAPVVDVDQAGACNSTVCYQPNGTEILRSTRQPVVTPPHTGPSQSGKGQQPGSKQNSHPRKKPWCLLVCGGVQNWWSFAGAAAETLGSLAGLGLLIAALVGAQATTAGVATFLANFALSAGAFLIRSVIDGLQGIMDSFAEHDPGLDLLVDILKIGLDLAALVTLKIGFSALKEVSSIQSAGQVQRFMGSIGQILRRQPVTFMKYVGPSVAALMALVGAAGYATSLVVDVARLGNDYFNVYLPYAQSHDPSAGWNTNML
jgi:RHS repeat-associated protein